MKTRHLLYIILAALLCVGCHSKKPVYDETVLFPNHAWNRFNVVTFQPQISRTDVFYDIEVSVHYADGFEYSEIPINTVMKAPDGQVNVMRKVLGTRKADGSHEGSVYGDTWTVTKTVHAHRKFRKAGNYTIEVHHMTQYFDLRGIEGVSCVVKPSEKQ